jgi:osmoprotectant transport system permease protein
VRSSAVLLLCSALAAWAAFALPLVRVAPNRLLSGEPVYLSDLLTLEASLLFIGICFLLLWLARLSPVRRLQTYRSLALVLLLTLMSAALFALTSHQASKAVHLGPSLVRTSLGAGFWTLMMLAWLVTMDTLDRAGFKGWIRTGLLLFTIAPIVIQVVMGRADDLSIMKEYFSRSDLFWQAVWRHQEIVLMAIVPSVLLGLPLAWGCQHFVRLRRAVFPVLNLVQTIPSIALFSLLMAPLAWLAVRYPSLAQAGISGVGLAPAVLALVLYSLLPVVRSGLAGLEQVPQAARSAARAMGMSTWQVFAHVELPLALPMLLPGLRTAVVQTIGLTAVTALIGAGGLGTLMFDGLFSAANELVLLGVLPIVLLAALADALFDVLSAWLNPYGAAIHGVPD